ncbi:MAG: dihydrolipoyl dehydrogenase, partial [Demequina sp.]
MTESTPHSFDVLVLGGGSGGYAAALRAAQLGMHVGLVEEDKVGGTCLHNGCIPTKALLHAADVADNAREGSKIGVNSTLESIDMAGVNKYKQGVVDRLYKGLTGLVKSRKVTLIEGHGTLVAPDAVEVNGERYTGKNIVLATGSYSKSLPGLEIGGLVMTSDQALELDYVPSSVVVLGGGVIGSEFASVWTSFGTKVTIVEALDHLVPNEDPVVSTALERAFKKRGIDQKLGVRFKGVEQNDSGVKVTLEDDSVLEADLLLVAVGRGPRTAGIGFEDHGIRVDRGYVLTDDNLHTGVGNIYAVGDIVPGLQLAHRGFQQGIFVAETIAGMSPMPIEEKNIPRVTYCEPEIASVGITEAAAIEEYGADSITALEYNLGGNGKSQILGTAGFIKLVRVNDGPVVGIHMIGSRIGEQIGEAQLIVSWDAHPEDVAPLLHA